MINQDEWHVSLHVLKDIEVYDSGSLGIILEDGWGFATPPIGDKPSPSPGDVAVIYSTSPGLGGRNMGLVVNDITYFYKTREQAEQERQEWLADYERERRERYVTNIDKWLETKYSLRQPLIDRLDRFEGNNQEEFWLNDGGYELFVCQQANALLDWAEGEAALGSNPDADSVAKAIDWWANLSYAEQVNTPGYIDSHSGNTHGGMIMLARSIAQGYEV